MALTKPIPPTATVQPNLSLPDVKAFNLSDSIIGQTELVSRYKLVIT